MADKSPSTFLHWGCAAFVGAAATWAAATNWPATTPLASDLSGQRIRMAYDPHNNPAAAISVPKWDRWYYHVGFSFGDVQPNSNAVPVWGLRLRRRELNAFHGDMIIEIKNAAGAASSDSTAHQYEIRIAQTAWIAGETSWPTFRLNDAGASGARQSDENAILGLTPAMLSDVAEQAVVAAFGEDGAEPGICDALVVDVVSEDAASVRCERPTAPSPNP